MKVRSILFLFLLFTVSSVRVGAVNNGFDKSAFYNALASENMEAIDNQLAAVKVSAVNEKDAYEGVLLMKKAGLVTKAKEKLSLFKAGRQKLEAAIKKDKENAEFSFLRLIIQEHAPKLVDYSSNIPSDVANIRSGYKSLPAVVQQAINDYSKKSKVLKPL